MIKVILGSVVGGVVALTVALVAAAQGRPAPDAAWSPVGQANAAYAMPAADGRYLQATAPTAPAFVQCEPHQEAVLQRLILGGQEVAQVACVTRVAAPPAYVSSPAGAAAPVYYANAPAYTQADIVQRPVVRTAPAQPRAQRVVYRQAEDVKPQRSWKKTALVIGGSTGAGAGVGAIAGGKKGALIGAAVGGGAASIYETAKRR
jgi:hypothetical protein